MKNYLKYSLWLTLIVLFALIGMHWLPAITIDGHTMRRVDLLSDVRMPEPDKDEVVADSLPPKNVSNTIEAHLLALRIRFWFLGLICFLLTAA